MSYKQLTQAASSYNAMRSSFRDIYDSIITAEACHLEGLPKEEQDAFSKLAQEVFKFDTLRAWGYSRFGNYLEDIDFEENGAKLNFQMEDYCRGCHMGTIYDSIFIPDWLIDAHDQEDDYDGSVFKAALERFMAERIAKIEAHKTAMEAKAAEEAEQARLKKEARDRAEYARLQAKFGDK